MRPPPFEHRTFTLFTITICSAVLREVHVEPTGAFGTLGPEDVTIILDNLIPLSEPPSGHHEKGARRRLISCGCRAVIILSKGSVKHHHYRQVPHYESYLITRV
jgi:hypothetical protein